MKFVEYSATNLALYCPDMTRRTSLRLSHDIQRWKTGRGASHVFSYRLGAAARCADRDTSYVRCQDNIVELEERVVWIQRLARGNIEAIAAGGAVWQCVEQRRLIYDHAFRPVYSTLVTAENNLSPLGKDMAP